VVEDMEAKMIMSKDLKKLLEEIKLYAGYIEKAAQTGVISSRAIAIQTRADKALTLLQKPCERCGGRGKIGCNRCDGRGWYLEKFSDNHRTTCDVCYGSKYVPCPACSDSQNAESEPQANLRRTDEPQKAESEVEDICKTCNGVKLIHSGKPSMYNCEFGSTECSAYTNGEYTNPDACKKCGKTVPCPECMPEANEYYLLWNRDLKAGNLRARRLEAALAAKEQEIIEWKDNFKTAEGMYDALKEDLEHVERANENCNKQIANLKKQVERLEEELRNIQQKNADPSSQKGKGEE
jgi:hypothetical protein